MTGDLLLRGKSITGLRAGDFDGLGSLAGLLLNNNSLTTLPDGVFDCLTYLAGLRLQGNPGAPFRRPHTARQRAV